MSDGVPPLGSLLANRYRLVRVIGTGGMGVVYEADDETTAKKVAIKILRATLLASGPFVERLRREARAITSLRHPNVVEVIDLDIQPDLAFLAMELLEGESLGQFLKDAPPLSANEVAAIGQSILEALAAAHEAGLVHRDVKPDNVFLARTGGTTVVKLLDFGLVKSIADEQPLTATGTVLGTWQYMAPEQANGRAVDGRADVYSAAACLYYALVRKRPYQAADMEASMFALSDVPAPPLRAQRPDLEAAFCSVIERGLDKSLVVRPTARAFCKALEAFAAPSPRDGSVTRVAVASVAALEACAPTTEREPPPVESAPTTLDAPVPPRAATPDAPRPIVDTTERLAKPPVSLPEIVAPQRTVPMAPVVARPLADSMLHKKPSPRRGDRRVAILVVVAFLLFGVGVAVGRTFIFR